VVLSMSFDSTCWAAYEETCVVQCGLSLVKAASSL
jgi:hypothetical protein